MGDHRVCPLNPDVMGLILRHCRATYVINMIVAFRWNAEESLGRYSVPVDDYVTVISDDIEVYRRIFAVFGPKMSDEVLSYHIEHGNIAILHLINQHSRTYYNKYHIQLAVLSDQYDMLNIMFQRLVVLSANIGYIFKTAMLRDKFNIIRWFLENPPTGRKNYSMERLSVTANEILGLTDKMRELIMGYFNIRCVKSLDGTSSLIRGHDYNDPLIMAININCNSWISNLHIFKYAIDNGVEIPSLGTKYNLTHTHRWLGIKYRLDKDEEKFIASHVEVIRWFISHNANIEDHRITMCALDDICPDLLPLVYDDIIGADTTRICGWFVPSEYALFKPEVYRYLTDRGYNLKWTPQYCRPTNDFIKWYYARFGNYDGIDSSSLMMFNEGTPPSDPIEYDDDQDSASIINKIRYQRPMPKYKWYIENYDFTEQEKTSILITAISKKHVAFIDWYVGAKSAHERRILISDLFVWKAVVNSTHEIKDIFIS